MASKKKTKMDCCAPAPVGDYKPTMYISLEGQDVTQIKDLAVGDEVQILVTGKISGLSQRERPDYDDENKTRKSGDIDLKDYKVKVVDGSKNEFETMAEEDD